MPLYRYQCKNGHEQTDVCHSSKMKEWKRCHCGQRATLCIPRGVMAGAFKPYVEHNMTRDPIEITSKAQRDALCEKHNVTYDSYKNPPSRQLKSAVEDLSFETVKEALETGRTPDGEKLEAQP